MVRKYLSHHVILGFIEKCKEIVRQLEWTTNYKPEKRQSSKELKDKKNRSDEKCYTLLRRINFTSFCQNKKFRLS